MRHIVYALLICFLLPTSVVAAHQEGDHHHCHDDLAYRVFAVHHETGQLFYLDDQHLAGSLSLSPFTSSIVNDEGRFLVLADAETNKVQVVSTGLFLEEHGDHYDLVAIEPAMFWEFHLGLRPGRLGTYQDRVVAVHDGDDTVSVIRPESGVVTTFPMGAHGPAVLAGDTLLAIDADFDLLDVFDVSRLQRLVRMRIPSGARAIAALADYAWVATDKGLEVIELGHLHQQLLTVNWPKAPSHLYVQPESFWVYGVAGTTLYAVSTLSGRTVDFSVPAGSHLAIDEDHHYLAIAGGTSATVMIVEVGHGAPRLRGTIELAEHGVTSTSSLVWAGRDLILASGSRVLFVDHSGDVVQDLVLPIEVNDILVVSIPAALRDDIASHHDDHDCHECAYDGHDHGHHHEHDCHDHHHHDDHDCHECAYDGHDHGHHHEHDCHDHHHHDDHDCHECAYDGHDHGQNGTH